MGCRGDQSLFYPQRLNLGMPPAIFRNSDNTRLRARVLEENS